MAKKKNLIHPSRRGKKVSGQDAGDLFAVFAANFRKMTQGGSQGFIKRWDNMVAEILKDLTIEQFKRRVHALRRRLNKVAKLKPIKLTDKPKILPDRKFEMAPEPGKIGGGVPPGEAPKVMGPLELTGDTRRTGGVQEIRGVKYSDGSVEVEIGGTIEESISDLRRGDKLKEAGMGKPLDYTQNSGKIRGGGQLSFDDVPLDDYDRAHLWGHGFGDEARDGIMYAPSDFNRVWQNQGIEDEIRKLAKRMQEEGGEVIVKARARSHPPKSNVKTVATAKKGKPLNRKKGEFVLAEISYVVEVKLPDGQIKRYLQVDFEIPPPHPDGVKVPEPTIIPGEFRR